jgi:hypothetical protein
MKAETRTLQEVLHGDRHIQNTLRVYPLGAISLASESSLSRTRFTMHPHPRLGSLGLLGRRCMEHEQRQ